MRVIWVAVVVLAALAVEHLLCPLADGGPVDWEEAGGWGRLSMVREQ